MVAKEKELNIKIPYNFTPRKYQIPFLRAWDSGIKRLFLVWHRRSGKDKTVIANLIKRMMERKGTYYYTLPTYSQARKIVWLGADKEGFKFLDHFPKELVKNVNQQEMTIELVNGSIMQLIGADNIDRIVGTNPVGVVFSEYALMKPEVWNFIYPILKENGGWAVFVMTPRGTNHAYDLMNKVKDDKNWFVQVLTVDDTQALTREQIEEARSELPHDVFMQEYYVKFLDSGLGFFRRIDENTYKRAEYKKRDASFFQLGVDLAKYQDYTVITPFNLNDFHVQEQDSFNQMDYNLQKARIENSYLRHNNARIVMDSTGCLIDDQKIITARGLVPISEVKEGEYVLTADNTYQKIKNITSKTEITEVYNITPYYQTTPIKTSFTHLYRTVDNYKKAGDLQVGELLEIQTKIPDIKIDYKKEILKYKPFKLYHPKTDKFKVENFYDNPLFWRMVGYYFAEGYVRRSCGQKQLQFAFHTDEIEYHNDIKDFAELIGRKMYKRIRKDIQCAELSISCGWLVDWFAEFGKATTKKIPYWFDYLPDEFKIEVIKGYWRGDGDRTTFKRKGQNSNKSMFRFCSASKDLIVTMQRWLLHFGIISSLTVSKRLPNDKYVLNISSSESDKFADLINEEKFENKRYLKSKGKIENGFIYVPIKEITTETRLATLWEFETENHSCRVVGATLHNVGEPIFDDLIHRGLNVTPFRFSRTTRKDLLTNLQILLEQDKIKIPDDPILIDELKSMTYELTEQGTSVIKVPDGKHDDRIMSLALSVWDIPTEKINGTPGNNSIVSGGIEPFYPEFGY